MPSWEIFDTQTYIEKFDLALTAASQINLPVNRLFGPLRVKTTSHIGVGPSKKEEKFPHFNIFPIERGGSGEVGMVSPTFTGF